MISSLPVKNNTAEPEFTYLFLVFVLKEQRKKKQHLLKGTDDTLMPKLM